MASGCIKATWTKLVATAQLQRSSHTVSVVGKEAFLFGGELKPRIPRDNKVFSIDIGAPGTAETVLSSTIAPSARVGAAAAALGGKMYLFSGRGGPEMSAVEEHGSLWAFDAEKHDWSRIVPADPSQPYPEGRSYHCATSGGDDKHIYIHAGCPATGRLQDLWAFNIQARTWQQLEDAPGPRRGGPSMAFQNGLLYRMNGFDGTAEQGGSIDVFDPHQNRWHTKPFTPDGVSGPAPRSVGTLLPVTVDGKPMLITIFGEGDPSSLGHAGAGKMFNDIWGFNIHTGRWHQIEASGKEHPSARGWFSADVIDSRSVLISGGLDESNARLDDVWVLSF